MSGRDPGTGISPDAPLPRKEAVQTRLDLLQLGVARSFTNPADAAEASVPDRQGIGSARLADP
jgi:hypothetical protein